MTRAMRAPSWIALALLGAGCSAVPRGLEESWGQQFLLTGGQRRQDSVVEENSVLGFELATTAPGTGGWGYELEARYAWGDERQPSRTRDVYSYEVGAGVRQTLNLEGTLRPFFGAGAAWMVIDLQDRFDDGSQRDDRDNGFGGYAHTGLVWVPSGRRLNREWGLVLGCDLRGVWGDDYSYLELTLLGGLGR